MVRIVKKAEERRKEIIDMAQKLFLEKDYESTSLNEVITELGVAKGTVYHYFKSKEDLLDAVVTNMSEPYLTAIQEKLATQKGSAIEKLKTIAKAMNISKDPESHLDDLHKTGNMVLHVKLLGELIRGLAPMLANIIEQGCREGVFQTKNPLEVSEFLLSGFQFMTDVGIFPWSQEELQRRKKSFSAIAESQLMATTGSLSFL